MLTFGYLFTLQQMLGDIQWRHRALYLHVQSCTTSHMHLYYILPASEQDTISRTSIDSLFNYNAWTKF